MINNHKDIDTQKQANAFVDLHATASDALSGNAVKAVELQKALAESSADLARMMIDAVATSHREITQMTLDAMSRGDPVALMTLAPRAAQTGLREGMVCASRAVQSARALGKTVVTVSETTKGGTDNP